MIKRSASKKAESNEPASNRHRPHYKMVVLAASAGGINALSHVLSALPADFPVPVAIVQHRTAQRPWLLHEVLSRKTGLNVKYAAQGELIRAGTVYIAPPDQHLRVKAGHMFSLTDHKRIRYVRSSANPLFSSAAEAFKEKVIAVVLTGGMRTRQTGCNR